MLVRLFDGTMCHKVDERITIADHRGCNRALDGAAQSSAETRMGVGTDQGTIVVEKLPCKAEARR
jgi:hypothetical protein